MLAQHQPAPPHTLSAPPSRPMTPQVTSSANSIARLWFSSFSEAMASGDTSAVDHLFLPEGYWRDLLALSWDHRTLKTPAKIKAFLDEDSRLKRAQVSSAALDGEAALVEANEDFTWVQSFYNFETAVGRGRGLFRLMQDKDGSWKCFTSYTGLEEIKGHEEKRGAGRPLGVNHGQNFGRQSWKARRASKKDFLDSEPEVLVIGAGQGGLTVGARLGQLNVDTLLVDKNERVGDNWRKRYEFLVLHDPVWYDHLPYIPFPPHWPVFTPKDKLGDWFEAYAASMELNVWMGTTVKSSTFDPAAGHWTVTLVRPGGEERTVKPKHVIMATGHSGEPNIPTFPGQEKFKGKLVHSSQHTTGGEFKGKKAVVVGCCNSGHDIAHDFVEQGADTTIVQRSSTYVMSSENGLGVLFKGLYEEGGPPTEDADIIFSSTPNPCHEVLHKYVTKTIADLDRETLNGLAKAGFKTTFGINDSGFLMLYFNRGGGYYLDVGASKLIADGHIKVKQGQEIDHFTEDAIVFADGTEIKADIVVLATGYKNMKTTAERILGPEASRMNEVWGLDAEGELKTMWRPSGHPNLWMMGGNLALCRFFSKRLALQVKARLEGIAPLEKY